MKGLDTNVLARYLTQDDAKQSKVATSLIEGLSPEQPGFVSKVVLCELVWVLESCYGQTRSELVAVIEQLLKVAELRLEDVDTVRLALADFRSGTADFSDHLLARGNLAAGCKTTYTFDKQAGGAPGFTFLR